MWRNNVLLPIIAVAACIQLVLVWQLVAPSIPFLASAWVWLAAHAITAALFGVIGSIWIGRFTRLNAKAMAVFISCCGLFMPGIGGVSCLLALAVAHRVWMNRQVEETDYVVTENASLPFTTPIGRKAVVPDSRGFVEQLRYSKDADNMYQKVLSSSYIRNSLSVNVLREAVKNPDERIRLTAYQILDRKVNELNAEIQRLEKYAESQDSKNSATTWLQIANNYWELITIEKSDPIARKQLLEKSVSAAKRSVSENESNRNAHLVLGRVCIASSDYDAAEVALKRSLKLGMPRDKVVPYLAEAAFGRRDFKSVRLLLKSLDDAFKQYPPLKQVAEYWA